MNALSDFLGERPETAELRDRVGRLLRAGSRAQHPPPVLIHGETGTGKGLLARVVRDCQPECRRALRRHQLCRRAGGPPRGRALRLPARGVHRCAAGQARTRPHGVHCLEGHCRPAETNTPFGPLLEIVSAACAIEDVDSPAVIGDKIAQALSGIGLEGGRLSSDLGYLLGAQPAAPGAPGPSLAKRLLAALAELIAGAAILLVVTSRGGARRRWASTAHALELTLPPLSAEDARGVIRGLIEAPLRTHDLERCILEQAEGNPLFLEELSRAAIERGQGAWAGAIPATIEKTVTARLDRLAPELRRLLAIGAAIGREVPLPLLCAVAEIDAQGLAAAGGRLQRGDFVYESGLHLGAIERLYPDRLSEQVGQLAYHALLADQRVRAVGYLRSSPRARCAPAA